MKPRNPQSTNVTTSAAADAAVDLDYFWAFGVLVLRRFFDPRPLAAEFELVMKDGLVTSSDLSKSREASFNGADGVVGIAEVFRNAFLREVPIS